MTSGKSIFVHAGAQRTGTSSFQMCLAINRKALKAQGFDLAYPGRDGIKKGRLGLRLPSPRHGTRRQADFAAKVAGEVAAHSPDPARALILSEENIPGPMQHFRRGKFYPPAAARFAALAEGLGAVAHLVYVVRSYGPLYVSAYRKRAEDHPMAPFAQEAAVRMQIDEGWPELVEKMRDIIRPARLTVIEYGARGTSVDLLRRLVPGLDDLALREPERTVNRSATDAALIELQRRYGAGETLKRREWKAVVGEHADRTESLGFAEFEPADARRLEARYAADLDRLGAMEGITLIR